MHNDFPRIYVNNWEVDDEESVQYFIYPFHNSFYDVILPVSY